MSLLTIPTCLRGGRDTRNASAGANDDGHIGTRRKLGRQVNLRPHDRRERVVLDISHNHHQPIALELIGPLEESETFSLAKCIAARPELLS
jgi:hypothetical protein